MNGTVVDVLLALLLVSYAVIGYRQGFVVSLLSLAGFIGGGLVGLWLVPELLQYVDWFSGHEVWRSIALIFGVFLCASLGQGLAASLGSSLRGAVRLRPARALDSVLGAALTTAVVALLVWFLAGALRSVAPVSLARAIGESRVLTTIDSVVPAQTGELFSGFRTLLDQEGFPRVFDGFQVEPIAPVDPPDGSVAASPAVEAAAASIVKVSGLAQACNRGQEGTGWVAAPERVVTNAHVVAGMSRPSVQIGGRGRSYDATIVAFDPRRDLAVLAVPGLPAQPLDTTGPLARGDDVVVAGFPLDGPYRLDAARVRQAITATGADIFGSPGVVRDVYSLYGRVEPGNSGGPLLTSDGKVAGVVFARSLDDADTGYALTMDEAAPVIEEGISATRAVMSSQCAAA